MNLELPLSADEPSEHSSRQQFVPSSQTDPSLRHARVGDTTIAYRLRRSKRRTIGFLIDAQGLAITAPHRVALADIEHAIAEKRHWITRKLVEWRNHAARRERSAVRWTHGGTLQLLGEPVMITVGDAAARTRIERDGAALHVQLAVAPTEDAVRHAVHGWLKGVARSVFTERLREFARRHEVAPARWALSSARTRWGSCSSSGAIRLNWRLVHFPLPIVDYVIAHELAHLAELNHSPRFWQRVSVLYPDWQGARRWLRECSDGAVVG